jgi:hypothetical protein
MAGLDAGADAPAESAEELVVTVDEPVSVPLPASEDAGVVEPEAPLSGEAAPAEAVAAGLDEGVVSVDDAAEP